MSFRRTTLIAVGCASALVGIGLARIVSFDPPNWPLILAAFCLLLLKPKNITGLLLVIFLGLSLGLWRGEIYMQKLSVLKDLTGSQVTIEATATSDSVYTERSQIEFTANHTHLLQGQSLQQGLSLQTKRQPLAGNFKISGFGVPMVYRGDRVQISGKLFPMRGSNQARIAYAQLKILGKDDTWINKFTRQFSAGMQTALPEPNASFGLGLLIGQRTTLPKEILNDLTVVGLVHIVAVSGYNLTILVRAIGRAKLGSKYQRLLASLIVIGGFILMTGFSASIVRAALVSGLGLWAWYFGRKFRPILLILFAAAITGLFNPFYVWSDLGWYLSFLAFFGILIIAPLLAKKLFRRRPKNLTMVVIETLSAEIMTLPLIMMTFGQVSLVALLANTLVVPLVPIAMLLSAIAAGAGMWLPAVAGWFAWPANLLLTYILEIAHFLANIPSVLFKKTIGLDIMLSFYAFVIFAVIIMSKKVKIYVRGPRDPKSRGAMP